MKIKNSNNNYFRKEIKIKINLKICIQIQYKIQINQINKDNKQIEQIKQVIEQMIKETKLLENYQNKDI